MKSNQRKAYSAISRVQIGGT